MTDLIELAAGTLINTLHQEKKKILKQIRAVRKAPKEFKMTTEDIGFATETKREAQRDANKWTLEAVGGKETQKQIAINRPCCVLLPSYHLEDNIELKKDLYFDPNHFIVFEKKPTIYSKIEQQARTLQLNNMQVFSADLFDVIFETLRQYHASIGHIDADLFQCFDIKNCLRLIEECITYSVPSLHLTIDTHGGKNDFKEYMHNEYGYALDGQNQKEKIKRVLQDTIPSTYKWHTLPYRGRSSGNRGSSMLMILLQQAQSMQAGSQLPLTNNATVKKI
jgi:hypothetical protein